MSVFTCTDHIEFVYCRYDCIENELIGSLSSLQQATHVIAPYKSKGVERASELLDDFSVKTGMFTFSLSISNICYLSYSH